MQRHFDELDERGYTLLEQVLTQSQIEAAIAELRRSYEEEFVSAHEPGTWRTTNLTARAPVFRDLIQLPEVVACMSHLLGEDYVLADMGARSPLPGIAAQGLHRDGGPAVPNPPFNVHDVLPFYAQSMFALVDFTRENGATRLVPGSHATCIAPEDVTPEQVVDLICEAGTILIYDNRLLHGGGVNRSQEVRYAIQGFCCRRQVKPFCDHTRSIPLELAARESPLMRRLWGFECQVMWEEDPRRYRMVEVEGARPLFDYERGIDRG